MKNLYLIFSLCLIMTMTSAQDFKTIMKKRSRDFFASINSDDEKDWIKFIEQNFSPSLIKKPMKKQVQIAESGDVSSSGEAASDAEGTIAQKAQMFRQLHSDFAKGKIMSLKTEDNKATMMIESAGGLKGKFNLGFEKATGLIETLGIEIVQEQY